MTTRDIRTWAPTPPLRRPIAGRIVFWVLFALAVAALVACFAVPVLTVKPFTMPSDAMENTIIPGDSVFTVSGDLRRGDIVVMRLSPKLVEPLEPGGNSDVLTRLIALPGDHVACCNASGHVTVNGKALNETYIYPRDKPSTRQFSVTLRRGEIWVMGDHRSISLDSREWGQVPESGVLGRVILIHSGSSTTAPRTPRTYVANSLAPVDKRYEFWVLLAVVAVVSVALIVILTIFGTIRFVVRRRRNRRLAEPPRLPYALRPVRRTPVTPAASASAPPAPSEPASSEPASSEPASSEPAPAAPAEPAPAEPSPSEPAPAREPATLTADRAEASAESSEEPDTSSPEASANTRAEPPAAKAAEPPVAEAVDAVDSRPGEASVEAS
jgi:signal peptidase I